VDRIYKDTVLNDFCSSNMDLYQRTTSYFLSQIEFISGHRALRELLMIESDETPEIKE